MSKIFLMKRQDDSRLTFSVLLIHQYSTDGCQPLFSPSSDDCHSLLSGCPLHLLSRLQKVQSSAAIPVFKACKRNHVQPLLQALHWLLVQDRIGYKLSTVWRNFSDSSPTHFSDLPTIYAPSRQFQSSADTWHFVSPKCEQKPLATTVCPTVL